MNCAWLRHGAARSMGALLLVLAVSDIATAEMIPLPRVRPREAPQRSLPTGRAMSPPERPAAADAPAPDVAPSACRLALTDAIAVAPSLPPIADAGECGGLDLVALKAVRLADGSAVAVEPPATLRCRLAAEIADWVRSDIAPALAALGKQIARIENYDSYSCRGRNRVFGAKLSEHGKANAIDIRGLVLRDGSIMRPTETAVPLTVRESLRASACRRFATVLGPGSDGYHESHVHVDLAERRGGYRMCQWDLRETAGETPQPIAATPSVRSAIPLPFPRPARAPPR